MDPPQTTFTADAIIDAKIFKMYQLGLHRADRFRHLQGLFQEMLAVALFYGGTHNPEDFYFYIVMHKYSFLIPASGMKYEGLQTLNVQRFTISDGSSLINNFHFIPLTS